MAILDLVGGVQGGPAAQLTLQVPTADAMDDPTQVRLVVRNDTRW